MIMKKFLVAAVLTACALTGQSAVYESFTATPDQPVVPDASLAGWQDSMQINSFGAGAKVTDVKVEVNLSGGFNGDLYAYLAHDGQKAILLNRPGTTLSDSFGYTDSGLDVTFTDAAGNNIHMYASVGGSITGGAEWKPDARDAMPLLVNDLVAPSASASLSTFSSHQTLANGTWTLFVADVAGGGGNTHVNSWKLQVQAIPEPIHVALGIFGGLFGLLGFFRSKWARRFAKKA